MHIPRFTPVPPDYVQGWSNPDDWWYMPAYMGGGGLAQGAPIPGKSYGGSPSAIGSGTGGGPVAFPNYGTGGGGGGGSNFTSPGTYVQPDGSTVFVDPKFDGSKTLSPGPGGVLPMPGTVASGGGGGTLAPWQQTPPPGPYIPLGGGGGGFGSVIQSLITPGLVPDVARQGAELAAGRGIGGSPAGASTAVRMSEQDYLTRLGLANTLLSGESQRRLPYDITPFQQQQLALQQQQLQLEREIAAMRYPHNVLTGFRGPSNTGRGSYGGGGYGGGYAGNQLGGYSNPGNFAPGIGPLGGNRIGGGGGVASNSYLFGLGGGQPQLTLDDIYEELGFGNFGSLPGDQTTEPPDFSYDMWD